MKTKPTKLLFWELKEGMYVRVNVSTTPKKRGDIDDTDDDTPLKLNGSFVGIVSEIKNDRAIVKLASGGQIALFNTGYLSTNENKIFPFDTEEITEAQYLIDKL